MPEYRLLREHRIDKVLQPVGAIVTLPEQIGEWLASQSVVERMPSDVVPHMPMRFAETVMVRPRAQVAAQTGGPKKCCGRW